MKTIGRNQKPCVCGKDIKYKMCCGSKNTNLKYWEKNNVSNTTTKDIQTIWNPKLNKGKINFNNELNKILSDRNKLYDEFGGDKFKDIIVSEWLNDYKPYTEEYVGKQETWNDTSELWIDSFNRTHDRWRKLLSEKDEDLILLMKSSISVKSKTTLMNSISQKEVYGHTSFSRLPYKIDRDTKSYEQMLKEYDDICIDKLVLDKVNNVKGGWFKPKNHIINLRTCDVDINKTNIWCVFNDYCYSHLEWLNKWKEELIEIVPTQLIGIYMRDWYFKLGLPLNKVEREEGHLDELFQFFTKIKETSNTTWDEVGMNMCYDFHHTINGKGLEEWGGRNFMIMIQPHSEFESLSGGNDKGIITKSDNEMITIYRNVLDLEYKDGFSWSTDSSQSLKWGISRHYVGCGKDKGYLLEGEVMKKDIMGYTNHNDKKGGMNEVFVHPFKVTITKTTELNKETIQDILYTDDVVRKDILHCYLSNLNINVIGMWEKICEFEFDKETSLMKQTFLGRLVDIQQMDKSNITKTIESGEIVMEQMKETKRPKLTFTPQTSMDMKLVRNPKLMFQTQQNYQLIQNKLLGVG